uniref:Uncharacterized protein n=1 Tax=Utricularia reniformis TaxID=192314 RepID=A0A1Y0B4B1_9LAMI|nr:hypothetical protein AEK19_MT2098 [Utricularia reniformis]ART32252.1 hypothetical protein AEK19_MT2098 [Utricularia reniformis]
MARVPNLVGDHKQAGDRTSYYSYLSEGNIGSEQTVTGSEEFYRKHITQASGGIARKG